MGAEKPSGTNLAERPDMADLAVSGEVWRDHRNRHFLATARQNHAWMMLGGGAFQAAAICALATSGFPTWRVVGLGAAFLALAAAQRVIVLTVRRPAHVDAAFFRVAIVAQAYLVASLLLSGGLASPYIGSAILPVVVPLLFFGPHAVTRGLTALWVILILGVAALPAEITGPPIDRATFIWTALASLGATLFVVKNVFRKIADAAHGAACAIDEMREERMSTCEAHGRRLQSVGSKVAHELKNPLAAVKGLVQLVARTPDSDRTQERLAVMQAEITRMETILREYLSFARPLEDLAPEPIDLGAIASDIVEVFAGRADQGRIAIRVDTRATPLSGDPRRLREALTNLLANAVEATPPGGKIEVRTLPAPGGGGVVEIRDTGRGISAENLERLGRSFFTTRDDGTGLGVVLAHGVVAQHGGKLHYASEAGRGTMVTMTLPPAPGESHEAAITTSPGLPRQRAGAGAAA